jgi:hypothetical protein
VRRQKAAMSVEEKGLRGRRYNAGGCDAMTTFWREEM